MSKILYTMIRVGDLDRSIAFYKRLGMHEVRRRDVPDGKYTLVFLGFEGDSGSRGSSIESNNVVGSRRPTTGLPLTTSHSSSLHMPYSI